MFYARRWGELCEMTQELVWSHDSLCEFISDFAPVVAATRQRTRNAKSLAATLARERPVHAWPDVCCIVSALGVAWTEYEAALVHAYLQKSFGLEPDWPLPPEINLNNAIVKDDDMDYSSCSREELVAALREQKKLNACLRETLYSERLFRKNLDRRHRRSLAELERLEKRQSDAALALVHTGKTKTRYTPYGGLRMAAKRNMSNVAAYNFGVNQEVDVSHTTVVKWEVALRASMIASLRKWHIEHKSAIVEVFAAMLGAPADPAAGPAVTYSLNTVRGDASQVMRFGKVHILEVVAGYIATPVDDSLEWHSVYPHFTYRKDMGDLQICGKATAEATHALVRKQLLSIAGSWEDRVVDHRRLMFTASGQMDALAALEALEKGRAPICDEPGQPGGPLHPDVAPGTVVPAPMGRNAAKSAMVVAAAEWRANEAHIPRQLPCWHISVFTFTTDAGSDELGARAFVHAQTGSNVFLWLFDTDCFEHQGHLMVKSVLQDMDAIVACLDAGRAKAKATLPTGPTESSAPAAPADAPGTKDHSVKYYSTLAMVMHNWRNNAAAAFRVAKAKFGASAAMRFFSRVPPKPISGRWGNASLCEERILGGREEVLPRAMFQFVLLVILTKRVEDTISMAEGRASASTLASIDDLSLDDLAAHNAKESKWARGASRGIRNVSFFIAIAISYRVKQPLQRMFRFLMKKRSSGEPQNMAEMVWFKAEEIRDDFKALRNRDKWGSVLRQVPASCRNEVWAAIQRQVVRTESDYDRRIMARVRAFPCALLMLVKSPANSRCADRERVSNTLLDTPIERLHVTARKIVMLFGDELRTSVARGTLCMRLYVPLRIVALFWKADQQEIEGMNGMLQAIVKRSPHLSFVLADARMAMRKQWSAGWTSGKMKWSVLGPMMETLLQDALDGFGSMPDVLVPDRFETPSPTPKEDLIDTMASRHVDPTLHTPAIKWAERYARKLQAYITRGRGNGDDATTVPCIRFSCADTDPVPEPASYLWVHVRRYGYTSSFVKYALSYPCGGKAKATIQEPLTQQSSLMLFSEFYKPCVMDKRKAKAVVVEVCVECIYSSDDSTSLPGALADDMLGAFQLTLDDSPPTPRHKPQPKRKTKVALHDDVDRHAQVVRELAAANDVAAANDEPEDLLAAMLAEIIGQESRHDADDFPEARELDDHASAVEVAIDLVSEDPERVDAALIATSGGVDTSGREDPTVALADAAIACELMDVVDSAEASGAAAAQVAVAGVGASLTQTQAQAWCVSLEKSCRALAHWQDAVTRCTTSGGDVLPHFANLSLVVIKGCGDVLSTQYVNWRSPSDMVGQEVVVRDGKVIFSMVVGPYAKPFVNYKNREGGCVLLHPDCGVAMRKVKEKGWGGRPSVCDEVLRLDVMVRVVLRGPADGVICDVCDGDEEAGLMTCVLCLQTVHAKCRTAEQLHSLMTPAAALNLRCTSLPLTLQVRDRFCAWCSEIIRRNDASWHNNGR